MKSGSEIPGFVATVLHGEWVGLCCGKFGVVLQECWVMLYWQHTKCVLLLYVHTSNLVWQHWSSVVRGIWMWKDKCTRYSASNFKDSFQLLSYVLSKSLRKSVATQTAKECHIVKFGCIKLPLCLKVSHFRGNCCMCATCSSYEESLCGICVYVVSCDTHSKEWLLSWPTLTNWCLWQRLTVFPVRYDL
jgi:hypothetical protein